MPLHCRCIIPWVQSRFFKSDVNNDYGTYAESGDIVEAIDRNPQYEPTTENRDQGRPLSDYDYDYMGDSREESVKNRRQLSEDEYDQMG